MTCCAFQLVGLITSYVFFFDGLLFHVLINMYYYFHSTANSESKDFFAVFLDHEFDANLNKVDRWLIIKPTEANGHSLMFSQQSNSPIHKRPTDHIFCDQMFEFQH